MEGFWQDVRFGARLFRKSPGFLAMAVLALGLGIGANTAVFSVVHGVLLAPLPYPEPERLVVIYDTQPDCKTCPASFPKYVDWRDQNRVFDVIGGSEPADAVMTGRGEPERVAIATTTASVFRVLGVPPRLGRWLTDEEDRPGGPKVALLSYGFWTRRFGRDPRNLGQTVVFDEVPRTIVGVMPQGFTHRGAEAFVPLARAFDESQRDHHFLATYGRLKAGVSVERARREMIALGACLAREHHTNHGIDVQPYRSVVIRDAAAPLLLLQGAVAFVLLIACANVANLLLARAAARRREIAVRTAMGATRGRLVRQFLTESVMLALLGAALGLGLASAGVRVFVATAPPIVPRMASITVDVPVLLFALGLALVTGILFGLAPMLHAGSGEALKDESARSGSGRGSRRAGQVLVVAEIALAVVLLVGAGLMVKSLLRLQRQDLGLVVDRVLAFGVSLPAARYDSNARIQQYYATALARLQSVPGVGTVGVISNLPFRDGSGPNGYFEVQGKTLWRENDAPLAEWRLVDADYYRTMGIPLVSGRFFTEQDDERAKPVVIVNQALARRCWPNEDAVGKRINLSSPPVWAEVVGVVGDVRTYRPGLPPPLEIAGPYGQTPLPSMSFVIRTATADPASLVAVIRREMAEVDGSLPLFDVATMEQRVRTSLAQPKLLSVLISAFAALAALLALIGVYGLMAYSTGQQRHEFGVRLAMGAAPGTLLRMVLARGAFLAALGIGLGGLGAMALTRLMNSMLYQATATDPTVLVPTCIAVFAAALAACSGPARAAARVDPIQTLGAS